MTLQWSVVGLAAIASFIAYHLCISLFRKDHEKAKLWAQLNVVGLRPNSVFAWTRARFKSLTSTQAITFEGYKKYTKAKGLPFALPTMWTDGAVVVMPPSLLHLLGKPEYEVRAFDAQLETIQLPYMIADPEVYNNVIHFDVVRKHMYNPKDIAAMASATCEEIDVAFGDVWGTSKEWTTVNGWDVCGRIIAKAVTRILIGLPMCRDEDFFEQSRLFSYHVLMGSAMLNCLPPMLRPLVAPLITLKAKYHRNRCLKILAPFVEDRIRQWRNGGDGKEVPNDFLQWMIPRCVKAGPEQMDVTRLATRLLAINVMFVIAEAYVFSHCVMDLYGNPSKEEFIQHLESECRDVINEYGDLSTKEAVDHLHRTDSALRESMRVSDVGVTTLARDVASGHLDCGNGIKIPQGTRIVFPTQPIHQDSSYYEDPMRFDPFRFSRKHEGNNDATEASEREHLALITDSFLAFGYGKHACPGRAFAAQTMKQALAHIVMNYDVEVLDRPATRTVLMNMMVPATEVKFRIRRKT